MTTHPLYVAFIWHHHQPLYKTRIVSGLPEAGKYRLPWVRLHGIKDYLDLALTLSKYPKLHQTFNLTPSLLVQLEEYAQGTAIDPYLAVTLTPTEQLTIEQKKFIIQRFFDANYSTLIAPHPRYRQLYDQYQTWGETGCLEQWNLADYSDLLAWHNLAWFDPMFHNDAQIAEWLEQQQGFTLSDRQRIYSKQQEIIRKIIPQHDAMQRAGQIEIITSPYAHPILPLLYDTNCGQVAIPDMILPEKRFTWGEDIPRHLGRSQAIYQKYFGKMPMGLWPSEQAVSPEIISDIIEAGFHWICSDEAVLGWSLNHYFQRNAIGNLLTPEVLYRPYQLQTNDGDLNIVFRDHRLSDLIGFSYSNLPANQAVEDLISHLQRIYRQYYHACQDEPVNHQQPWLVTIALDGENCWEFYQQDGTAFLELLYRNLSEYPEIQCVTVSEYLQQFPPCYSLPVEKLHTGSWVDGSLSTWIGDPAKNRAWDILTEARETLAKFPQATPENNPEAWDALYAAEGSDWFWWLGAGHNSHQDAIFDQVFREHIGTIYQALNLPLPATVLQPIEVHQTTADYKPQSFIHPPIDGLGHISDWEKAGRIEIGAKGAMHSNNLVQKLYYGVDYENFYLRLDFNHGVKIGTDTPATLYLFWYYVDQPLHNSPIPLINLPNQAPFNYLFHHSLEINLRHPAHWLQEAGINYEWHPRLNRVKVSSQSCLEIAVPWADLQVKPDWSLQLILVWGDIECFTGAVLENKLISLQVP